MALNQVLFQFLPECPYCLCLESQISRQTVLDLGPSLALGDKGFNTNIKINNKWTTRGKFIKGA